MPAWDWKVMVRRPVPGPAPHPAPSRSTPRGSGSTGRRLCVLHEGPTYLQYSRPSSSSTPPSCSTRRTPPKYRWTTTSARA